MGTTTRSSVANSVPFDNSTNGFSATSVQDAIEEAATLPAAGPATFPMIKVVQGTQINDVATPTKLQMSNWLASDVLGLNDTEFTPLTTGVQCNFTGIVEVRFDTELTSVWARTNVAFIIENGNTVSSPEFRGNYIRAATGHNESSQGGTDLVSVTAGDIINIKYIQRSANGIVICTGANLILKQVR